MTYQPSTLSDDLSSLPKLPVWVTSECAETLEDVAFLSGAALSHLHLVLRHDAVPQTLLRERLALRAAEACLAQSGRPEGAADLRDAVHFLQAGDHPGPAGETYLSWRRAAERPISVKALHRALPRAGPQQIAAWLDGSEPRGAVQGAPIARVGSIIEAVLQHSPREQTRALLLADAALALSLGGTHMIPLLGFGLTRHGLRAEGVDLRQACHHAIVGSVVQALRDVSDLARRAARLRAVAPKLRAKGSDDAVALFLSRDAVAPAALSSLRSDRAARRFCDRLVALGAVREMTGRDTFRLYGL